MRGGGRWLVVVIAVAASVALLVPEAADAAAPDVTLSAVVSSFGAQLVGVKSDALSVKVTNAGTAPLLISTFRIDGDDAADFAQAADCPVSPDAIPPGGSCTVYLAFTPSKAGPETARFSIGDNAASSPQAVALTGTGTSAPQVLPLSGISGCRWGRTSATTSSPAR